MRTLFWSLLSGALAGLISLVFAGAHPVPAAEATPAAPRLTGSSPQVPLHPVETFAVEQLPAEVKEAALRMVSGGTITKASKQGSPGKVFYLVAVQAGANTRTLRISEDGKQVSTAEMAPQPVALGDLPAEVRATIQKELGSVQPSEVLKGDLGGRPYYTAHYLLDGAKKTLRINGNGSVIPQMQAKPKAGAPAAVKPQAAPTTGTSDNPK